jgi:deoxycytidylate deaminase
MTEKVRPTWDETWMAHAHEIAKRSLCDRDKVGAVIVASDNIPLISSYNNPPRGFPHNEKTCNQLDDKCWLCIT